MTTDTTGAPAAGAGQHTAPDPRRWLVLAVVLAGVFMILLDATIVNVTIPSVQESVSDSLRFPE